MSAARSVSRLVFFVSLLALSFVTNSYSQERTLPSPATMRSGYLLPDAWTEKCRERFFATPFQAHFASSSELTTFAEPGDEWNLIGQGEAACSAPPENDANATMAAMHTPDNPCSPSAPAGTSVLGDLPCGNAPEVGHLDRTPTELSNRGGQGARIARAREEVLAILESDNACTEWFESKDASPASTFQSLTFSIDQHGPENIFEWEQSHSLFIQRQPYVARATQDGGANTSITINGNGAFYKAQGKVQKFIDERGPAQMDGSRMLVVGSYAGNTLEAQIVTLLHEFGHIIDLLPEDADDMDGKSSRNTSEVLHHCRAEVETHAKEARHAARR